MRKIVKLNIFHLVEKIVHFHVDCGPQIRIALFTNMRILKFRTREPCSEPNRRLRFSLLSIILTDLLGNKTLLHGFKRSWFVICGFRSVLCVSLFQGSLLVIVIMIDGSDKHNCEGGFWTLEFACLWKAQLSLRAVSEAPGSGGINGQLTVCFSILLVFIQYNISV